MIDSKILKEPFQDTFILGVSAFKDHRGQNLTLYQGNNLTQNWEGSHLDMHVERILTVRSARSVIRGVHLAKAKTNEKKWVTCVGGTLTDFLIDFRPKSRTFMKNYSLELKELDGTIIVIPPGVGHAYKSGENGSTVLYFINVPYVPEQQLAINPFDVSLNIDWGRSDWILSDKDRNAPSFAEIQEKGILNDFI